jgi:uridine kinase
LVDVWIIEDITVLLQYRIDPMFEFSLFVTKCLPKEINRDSRKNWTIAKHLKNDFCTIFSEQEDSKIEV